MNVLVRVSERTIENRGDEMSGEIDLLVEI